MNGTLRVIKALNVPFTANDRTPYLRKCRQSVNLLLPCSST